jgi:DmsE family decaheme c-type cytochrome
MPAFRARLRVLLALAGLLAWAGASAQPATPPAAAASAAAASPAAAGASAAVDEAASAPAKPKVPLPPREQYSDKGADTCLECHDDVTPGYSGAAIFKGKHGHRNDKRAPFGPGGLQCEACHGPGARHARSKNPDSIYSNKASSSQTVQERNQTCLGCHQAGARIGWHASTHERSGVACADCHRIHQDRDPVLVKSSEPDVCLSCHRQKRADFQKPSTHPVRFGLMGCSDCHSPHGSTTVAMLNKPTLNQTCFSCHADKRGPMLWEHAPVAEDCALCHTAHGSLRNALLTKTPPLLCQQCHAPADHPSVARTSQSLPGGTAPGGSIFLVAGGCTNCHSRVHGSNHPAGAKLMR